MDSSTPRIFHTWSTIGSREREEEEEEGKEGKAVGNEGSLPNPEKASWLAGCVRGASQEKNKNCPRTGGIDSTANVDGVSLCPWAKQPMMGTFFRPRGRDFSRGRPRQDPVPQRGIWGSVGWGLDFNTAAVQR
ncbi:hypothetical protein ACO22_04561 [Paracoccidioides brasiliensis]|uniref:Uncharacterized protein n=1 Tax=Paracoccidioides brasiliensis TaxID=121759 RepID=A0A1D2JCR0_PARBR|nr:hypothetical protein ACO22_04561 [Paracoccidioides brasiliensis]